MRKTILILFVLASTSYGQVIVDNAEKWTGSSIAPWTTSNLISLNTISSTTERAYSGSYGIKVEDNSTSGVYALLGRALLSDATYYARWYVNFPETFFSTFPTTSDWRNIMMVSASTATTTNCFPVVISAGRNASLTNKLRLHITNNDQLYTSNQQTMESTINMVENTWYCLDVMLPTSSGTIVRWWIDEVEQSTGTFTNFKDTAYWNLFNLGFGYATTPWAPEWLQIYYIDSVHIHQAPCQIPIGKERPIRRKFYRMGY